MRNLLSFAVVLAAIMGTFVVAQTKPAFAAGDTGAPPAGASSNPVVGVWQGTTVAGCNVAASPDRCNAQQSITLTVIERENGKIAGSYRCRYGTQDCLRMSETGKVVSAGLQGSRLTIRAITDQGFSYIFTGRMADNAVNGGYTCYTGGALLEQGSWHARRSY